MQNRQILRDINVRSGYQGTEKGKGEADANRYRVSFCGDENILKLDGGDICTTHGIYYKYENVS